MQETRQTLGTCLRKAAAAFGGRRFASCGDRALSFAELDRAVDRIAGQLIDRGIGRGSRVSVLLPNIIEFPVVFLAIARIGALSIPIGTRYTGPEIVDLLRRSRSELLVTLDSVEGPDHLSAIRHAAPDGAGGAQLPDLREIWVLPDPAGVTPGAFPWAAMPDRDIADNAEFHDPVVVVYTSGTSGAPKGAVHGHVMLRNVANMVRAFAITRDDNILAHMPFNHVAGLCAAIIPAVLTGAAITIVRRWDADAVAGLIQQERVTLLGGIPTHFTDLLEAVERGGQDTSSLRTAWIGGAAISPELARRALVVLSLGSLQAIYGMTETTSTTTLTPIGASVDLVCANKGKPIGTFEVAVFDPETDAPLAAGTLGEVRVRGHVVMQGYLDDPVATAEAINPDGWFRTGDLGRFDDDGYLAIEARLKDVFRVGGSTVSPAEVEWRLVAIEGVRQAVVVGVPDARLGEVGFAFVQPVDGCQLDEADLLARLATCLAPYKRPRFIRIVDSFPMTSTGKIQRQELRDRATEIISGQRICTAA